MSGRFSKGKVTCHLEEHFTSLLNNYIIARQKPYIAARLFNLICLNLG